MLTKVFQSLKETWAFIRELIFVIAFLSAIMAVIFGIPTGLGFFGKYLATYFLWSDPCTVGILCGAFTGAVEVIGLFFYMILEF